MVTVVIIEDDLLALMALRQLFEEEGFMVNAYSSTETAYSECSINPPDYVIADWCVPGDVSTQQLVSHLRDINPNLRAVFISGYEPDDLRAQTKNEPWMSYVSKPIPFDLLIEEIKESLREGQHTGATSNPSLSVS